MRRIARRMRRTRRIHLLLISIIFIISNLCIFLALSNPYIFLKPYYKLVGRPTDVDLSCYFKTSKEHYLPLLNEIEERERLSSGRNIFFHETSCLNETGKSTLTCRQACAVESAALMNPKTTVNLFTINPLPPTYSAKRLFNTLLLYENVRINRITLNEYVLNSPVEEWFKSEEIMYSWWPVSHMSDMLRFLTLWKFSGIYLDLDVIVTKSLEDLTDFAGAQDFEEIASGILGFSKTRVGRKIANDTINNFVVNFRGDVWSHNGPGAISRTLRKFCGVYDMSMIIDGNCHGFTAFEPSVFYPISYKEWQLYFSKEQLNRTMSLIDKAKAIHVWNKFSKSTTVTIGSGVPYDLVAKKYCPKIYESCGKTL